MSHHTMSAFFSGTDSEELTDNAEKYNYYVSLIVNFSKEWCAKIAIPSSSNISKKIKIKDEDGKYTEVTVNKNDVKELFIGDLDIEFENKLTVDDWFVERYEKVKKENDKKITAFSRAPTGFSPYTRDFNSFEDTLTTKTVVKEEPSTIDARNFAKSILSLNNINDASIYFYVHQFKQLTDAEKEIYLEMVDAQLEILHFNVYGSHENFEKHFDEAVDILMDYAYIDEIKELVEHLSYFETETV